MRGENASVKRFQSVARILLLSLVLCVAGVVGAWAIGGPGYRNPESAALGLDTPSRILLFGDTGRTPQRWWVEAGQWRLFDIEDLASNGAEFGVRYGRFGVVVSSLFISSPVGMESRYLGSIMWWGPRRIRIAPGIGAEVVTMDGFEKAVLLFATVSAVVELSDMVRLVSTIDHARIAGEPYPGADASASVVLFPRSRVCGLARVAVSRHGAISTGFGTRVRFSRLASAAVGYDESTGVLKGSVTACVRSAGVQAGATVHPVLGISKAVFVFWRR